MAFIRDSTALAHELSKHIHTGHAQAGGYIVRAIGAWYMVAPIVLLSRPRERRNDQGLRKVDRPAMDDRMRRIRRGRGAKVLTMALALMQSDCCHVPRRKGARSSCKTRCRKGYSKASLA